MKGYHEELEQTGFAELAPSSLLLAHTFGPSTFSLDFPLFMKTRIKMLRLNCFFGSSFPYGGSRLRWNLQWINLLVLFLSSVLGSSRDGHREDTFLSFKLKRSVSTVLVISVESRHSSNAGVLFLLFVSICAGLILSFSDPGSKSGVPSGCEPWGRRVWENKQRKSGKSVAFSVVLLVYLHTASLNICSMCSKPGIHKLQSARGAVSGPLHVFISGLSSASSHTCSSLYCQWLLFTTMALSVSCDRDHTVCKAPNV